MVMKSGAHKSAKNHERSHYLACMQFKAKMRKAYADEYVLLKREHDMLMTIAVEESKRNIALNKLVAKMTNMESDLDTIKSMLEANMDTVKSLFGTLDQP